jgi:hypothetical protein
VILTLFNSILGATENALAHVVIDVVVLDQHLRQDANIAILSFPIGVEEIIGGVELAKTLFGLGHEY